VLRNALQGAVQRLVNGGFPLGALAVNVLGWLVLGFLAAVFTGPVLIR
jgi:fluoride ion exporter CrcB/FEX